MKCLFVIHCVYMCVSLPHILTATYSVYSLSHPDYIFHFYLQTCDCDLIVSTSTIKLAHLHLFLIQRALKYAHDIYR